MHMSKTLTLHINYHTDVQFMGHTVHASRFIYFVKTIQIKHS